MLLMMKSILFNICMLLMEIKKRKNFKNIYEEEV